VVVEDEVDETALPQLANAVKSGIINMQIVIIRIFLPIII
jgi:hypothetical protein